MWKMAAAVCRDRNIFPQIAKNILRVDNALMSKVGPIGKEPFNMLYHMFRNTADPHFIWQRVFFFFSRF